MELIFELASSCEAGMLRNRAGRLTPEGYLGTWFKQLAAPLTLHRTEVTISSGSGYGSAMRDDSVPAAADLLAQQGRPDLAETFLAHRTLKLDLSQDADIVLALKEQTGIDPYRIVESWMRPHKDAARDPSMGYRPRPVLFDVPAQPGVLRLGRFDNCLAQRADGTWRSAGGAWSVVAEHVRALWQQELATPGCYRKSIGAVRDAFSNAPRAPAGLIVEIDPTRVTTPFQLQHLRTAREHALSDGIALQVPCNEHTEYALTHLPPDSAIWLVPDQSTRAAASHNQKALAL